MLFEEQNIMKEYSEYTEYLKALYQCAKIAQSLQCNIRPLFALGLLCFYSNLNVFNLSAVLIALSGIV